MVHGSVTTAYSLPADWASTPGGGSTVAAVLCARYPRLQPSSASIPKLHAVFGQGVMNPLRKLHTVLAIATMGRSSEEAAMDRVGVIGLGKMGLPIAMNL